ncbi:MAG: histone deacetylase family protein [Anaerolineae bacterium]|nr:histone deacetylase family protein [Anaerolineae bacterium]
MQIVYSERHKLHATDSVRVAGHVYHPQEVPARAEVILAALIAADLGPVVEPIDHRLRPILAVHNTEFITHLQTVYARGAEYFGVPMPILVGDGVTPERAPTKPDGFIEQCHYYTFDYEDPILKGTWDAAYWSAQCALTAADLVKAGHPAAYALCRPPGHHASTDLYGGFCYLNNAAIAVRYLQQEAPCKVAILDLDYHHGNGTQAIFYADPTVLYCSLHADPAVDYPFYWGQAEEQGTGAGLGYNYNWPLPLGIEDAQYLACLPAALRVIQDFAPRYLVVSLGLDTAANDPIGKFKLTTAAFMRMGRMVADLKIDTVVVQEGGYNTQTLGQNAVAFLGVFE